MAIVGRLLRDQMRADREEAKHPEWAGQRVRRRELAEQVRQERERQFPVITADNVTAVIAWQSTRIEELERAEGLR